MTEICTKRPRPLRRTTVTGVVLGLFFLTGSLGWGTPPNYKSFKRDQTINHSPREEDLLRIWMVHVEQGDGLLIQLPERFNYDPEGGDNRTERVDILVDGGANPASNGDLMREFVEELYPGATRTLEHAVITHHDMDHVLGLTRILEDRDTEVEWVYHNGLASYERGHKGFPAADKPAGTTQKPKWIYKYSTTRRRVTRGLAALTLDGEIHPDHVIEDLAGLRRDRATFQGLYDDLADAVLHANDEWDLRGFVRSRIGGDFISEKEVVSRTRPLQGISIDVLWPESTLRGYGGTDWGETINGNSITFKLTYGDFEMLFTGDHNEKSQEKFLEHHGDRAQELLDCDVLKVPHHGSKHGLERFFNRGDRRPVLSVASMGNQGFKSKAMSRNAWQHPAEEVIRWLGGSHRFYSTYIHERRFRYPDIDSEADRQRMIEKSHILIETDGTWFRLVEVPVDGGNPSAPPSVRDTRRGNGTRWIRAEGN